MWEDEFFGAFFVFSVIVYVNYFQFFFLIMEKCNAIFLDYFSVYMFNIILSLIQGEK